MWLFCLISQYQIIYIMKNVFSLLFFIVSFLNFYAQTLDAWVYFSDKPNAAYYFENPLEMLSQRALNRRVIQDIDIDFKDVPLYTPYVSQIKNVAGINVVAQSKWLNCLHVQGELSNVLSLNDLPFVDSIEFADQSLNQSGKNTVHPFSKKSNNKLDVLTDFEYGSAANQINMLNGSFLHQNNFTGTGMYIAVMDAGFTNVNTASGFQRLFQNNQILGTYNFVDRVEDVYYRHYHGTMVLSTMGGYFENQFVGTAPDASYFLFITEDINQEHPYEESLWVEAAEKADSLGVDVLNTSLGYTTFDNTAYNHTYDDLDGQSAFMSRGAEIAFSRGMLVVNSAGNYGNDAWHYIGVPADAESVLSIGAVNSSETIASFSSWGPTPNDRIKPDVCAQGESAAVINTENQIVNASGTSFSGPIFAGAVTCFWQAFPTKKNSEIAQAVKQSADRFNNPDDHYGYGIPDFQLAFNNLMGTDEFNENEFKIYPNPTLGNSNISIEIYETFENPILKINESRGRTVLNDKLEGLFTTLNISKLNKGVYFVNIISKNKVLIKKLIIE